MKKSFRIGIDEAWRWPWAGPVVACALSFEKWNPPENSFLEKLDDSKKLSEKKRDEIFDKILELSNEKDPKIFFEVWMVDNFIIDQIWIKKANQEAMQRALDWLLKKIIKFDEEDKIDSVLIDWNDNYKLRNLKKKAVFVIWWDWKIPEISASSIVAKVFRDKIMKVYWELYWFWFEKNKWYWVKKHRDEISEKWLTNIHRKSYKPVKLELEKKKKLLLHVCCWVDIITPILRLKEKYELIAYWYDPNIQPKKEHDKRYRVFKKICDREWVEIIKWPYNVENFLKKIKWFEKGLEGSVKCMLCYDLRLRQACEIAKKIWADWWTTTLNSSPRKSFNKLAKIWRNLEKEFWIRYIEIDFKKENWIKIASDYCIKHKVYRQNYCWCVFSDTYPK